MPQPSWKTGEKNPIEYMFLATNWSSAIEAKDSDGEDGGIVEGHAAAFNNVDFGYDRIMPGAFKKTLKEGPQKGKVPILSNHDRYKQIGWNLDGREDEKGLLVRGWYDILNNQQAKETYSLQRKAIQIKTPSGLSIGYRTIKADNDKDNPIIRNLWELKLLEYSPVVFPMNEQATVTAVKSMFVAALQGCRGMSAKSALEEAIAAMRQAGYSESDLSKALCELRAAEQPHEDPGTLSQSFAEGLKEFRAFIGGVRKQ